MDFLNSVWVLTTALLALILLAIAMIDIRTYRIPNLLNYGLICLGLVWAILNMGIIGIWPHLLAAFVGYVAIYSCNYVYAKWRKQDGIGMGDAKLLAAGGALLGIMALPIITLIATSSALIFAVVQALRTGQSQLRTALPFGPFLAFAIWAVWIWSAPTGIMEIVYVKL